jgi:hypothetical protein
MKGIALSVGNTKNVAKTRDKHMQDETLISITRVTDDDTGIYRVGDLDYGITGNLDKYLENEGEKGYVEICEMLDSLKDVVMDMWQQVQDGKKETSEDKMTSAFTAANSIFLPTPKAKK